MNSTAIRLYIVAAIVLVTYGISRWVQAETEPPEVEMPTWTFRELPLQMGEWRGEDSQMDPKIAEATGATVIVDRIYRSEQGHTISMHTAMFDDPRDGVYHSPMNCYLANGWKKLTDVREKVQIAEDMTVAVSLTTWEKENEKIMVAFWYQLGDHILYSRADLGRLRWSMRGQPTWPVLIKVMLQTSITEPEETKTTMLGFTEHLTKWLNQPERRKYLDRWRDD